jgi:polygalacturonase
MFRPPLVRLHNTVDIKIYNINLTQSACWTLWLANTTNVHVHDAFITSAHNGHNTDGIDIDCSVNVLVENVYYDGSKKNIEKHV